MGEEAGSWTYARDSRTAFPAVPRHSVIRSEGEIPLFTNARGDLGDFAERIIYIAITLRRGYALPTRGFKSHRGATCDNRGTRSGEILPPFPPITVGDVRDTAKAGLYVRNPGTAAASFRRRLPGAGMLLRYFLRVSLKKFPTCRRTRLPLTTPAERSRARTFVITERGGGGGFDRHGIIVVVVIVVIQYAISFSRASRALSLRTRACTL